MSTPTATPPKWLVDERPDILARDERGLPRSAAQLAELVGHLPLKQIVRETTQAILLGSLNADERVASFLLDVSARYMVRGYSATEFNLRMTREDIGSYLGLTLETVSRLMSRFQREGLIAANQREVELKNAAALADIVGHW